MPLAETKLEIQPLINSENPQNFRFEDRRDGREFKRKSIGDDKLYNPGASIPADTITQTMMANNSAGKAEVKYEEISITVSAGQTSGTGTATSGSVIIGYRSAGNNDQFVDNIALSGTTITITLAAAATADNTFVVICLKA